MEKTAFILIEIAVGKTKEVIWALQQLQGIKSVDLVSGPYDAIAVLEGKDANEIGNLVNSKIHPISGIDRLVVCLTQN